MLGVFLRHSVDIRIQQVNAPQWFTGQLASVSSERQVNAAQWFTAQLAPVSSERQVNAP